MFLGNLVSTGLIKLSNSELAGGVTRGMDRQVGLARLAACVGVSVGARVGADEGLDIH